MQELEYLEQCAIFEWARLNEKRIPELQGLIASANGGKRHVSVAVKLKKSGVKAGYPDIALEVPRGGFHGLRIELKAKGGRLSKHQAKWLDFLSDQGYLAVMCVGSLAAIQTIKDYLAQGNAQGCFHSGDPRAPENGESHV